VPRITSELVELTPDLYQWLEDEYHATLARHRQTLCSHNDSLEIQIPTILCESCFCAQVDGLFVLYRAPDVLSESWESDLANVLDEDQAASLAEDEDSPRCASCRHNLHGAPLYVETDELSERLGVPDETSSVEPSRRQRRQVFRFYGSRCFACGSGGPVEIDHIHPRSHGGTAAFQNLQPLCRSCAQAKADNLPQYIVAVLNPWPDGS
jgi:5-methylcytosine-specific restriction endonuclease McrA